MSDRFRTLKFLLTARSGHVIPDALRTLIAKGLARYPALIAATFLLLVARPIALDAHEVPARAAVIAFVKPEGQTLRVLARVPLEAMRDVQFGIRQDGTVDLAKIRPLLFEAAELWIANYLHFYENGEETAGGQPVAVQLSLPSNRAFLSFDSAYAHIHAAPLDESTQVQWTRALLDIELAYPIKSATSRFAMQSGLAHLGVQTTTVLRFLSPDHPERVFEYTGDPGKVELDPRWHQAFLRFVALGFEHILGGYDHLLFIFCLAVPVRRWRALAAIVTAFTAAHSITLIASAYGFAPGGSWFPPLVETLIALSIVYMAFENILAKPGTLEHRWLLAFAFGLIHGFGFSFALRESLQFAGSHLITSLAAFNVGVELGQLLVLVLTVPVLAFVVKRARNERAVVIVASALIAHSGWHWMTERFEALREYRITMPEFDAVFLLGVLRGLLLLAISVGVAWALSGLVRRIAGSPLTDVTGASQPPSGAT